MPKRSRDKTLAVAALELLAAYVATHPRGIEDAKRAAWLHTYRLTRTLAYEFGRLSLYAENKYGQTSA